VTFLLEHAVASHAYSHVVYRWFVHLFLVMDIIITIITILVEISGLEILEAVSMVDMEVAVEAVVEINILVEFKPLI
jgi:hypothetical protein